MAHTKWVCGWGTPSNTLAQNICDYFKDMTFRYQIFSTIDASALRIHLTNRYGHEPVIVTETAAALSTGGMTVDPTTIRGHHLRRCGNGHTSAR